MIKNDQNPYSRSRDITSFKSCILLLVQNLVLHSYFNINILLFFAVKGHPTLEKAAVSRKIPSTEPFNHRSHRISVN